MIQDPWHEFDELCERLPEEIRRQHLRQWGDYRWFDPFAIKELVEWGFTRIVQDPELVNLTRHLYDNEDMERVDVGQILAKQFSFYEAWLNDLCSTFAASSSAANWTERIFALVAEERITSRHFLEARLQVSQATLSRSIQELRDKGLTLEESVTVGPGRPIKAISLSAAGLRHAEEQGLPTSPAPRLQSQAIAERFFHQRIAAIYLNAYPTANIRQAYTKKTVQVDSALGSIYPDLVIQRGQNEIFIEAESGAYEYKRLREKLDKYLASRIDDLWVVTETQQAPTPSHIRQWLHDRSATPLENIPPDARLCIYSTSMDQLQRFGPEGNIWQIFRYGKDKSRSASPNLMWPHPAPQLRWLFEEWKSALDGDEFLSGCFSVEEPFVLRDQNGEEIDRLQADIVLKILCNSICQIYLEQPTDWSEDRVRQFLQDVDRFLRSCNQVYGKKCLLPEYHWLYGAIHLIHITPGETEPDSLVSAYGRWRQASIAFQITHGYPLIVRVAHIESLHGCTYLDVPEMSWDLSGMM